MVNQASKTLRLLFPQWQGGDNPPYYLGSKLLAWLAPPSAGPVEEVPVDVPTDRLPVPYTHLTLPTYYSAEYLIIAVILDKNIERHTFGLITEVYLITATSLVILE